MSKATQPATLADFLLARIAEDEAAAREASEVGPEWRYVQRNSAWRIETTVLDTYYGGRYGIAITHDREGLSDSVSEFAGPHIARHDPARVLRECEAKREIVGYLALIAGDPSLPSCEFARRVLADLASVYAGYAARPLRESGSGGQDSLPDGRDLASASSEPFTAYRCTACGHISVTEQHATEHTRVEHEPAPPGTLFCGTCKRHQCAGSLHPSMCVYAEERGER